MTASQRWKGVLWAITLCGMAFWLWRPIRYANDLWWHLAVGRYIAGHHTIPLFDVFSWTVHGHRWINHEWLFQLIAYGFYALKGANGILIMKIFFILLAIGIQWRMLAQQKVSWLFQWLAVAAMFWMSRYGWNERADLVSLLFLSGLTYTLDEATRQNEMTTRMAAWPFLFILWANMHGGFVLGLAVAAVWLLGALLEKRLARAPLAVWFALCAVATFINPNTYHLHLSTYKALHVLHEGFFTEWQRTPWHPLEGFWLCLFLFWLLAARFIRRTRQIPWPALLVSLFLSWSAVSHVRNVPYFMVCVFGWVILWLKELPEGRTIGGWVEKRGWILIAAAVSFTVSFTAIAAKHIHGGVQKNMFPIEACEFIQREGLPGTFYNEDGFGGYWMWTFGTERPVFLDGRFHTVEGYQELYQEVHRMQAQSPEVWQNFMDRYGMDAALLSYPDPPPPIPSVFRLYFPRNRWALIYWDDVAMIYVRRTPEFLPWIRRLEFQSVNPEDTVGDLREVAKRSSTERVALIKDLKRNLQEHPDSQRTQSILAAIMAAQQHP